MKLYWSVLCSVAALAVSVGAARAQDAQTLVSVKTEAPPAMDGRMSEA